MNHLLLLAALVGATLIVVRGTIFSRVRAIWPALLACSQCVGFWVGVAGSHLRDGSLVSLSRGWWIDAIVMGCAVSVISMATDIVLLKIADGPAEEKS